MGSTNNTTGESKDASLHQVRDRLTHYRHLEATSERIHKMLNGQGHDSRSHYCTPELHCEFRLLRSLTEELSPIFADVAKHR